MPTAPQLARRYDEYLVALHAALRRGGRGLGPVRAFPVRAFSAWVEGWWRDDAPPEPAGDPAAVSAGGWGTVRWHAVGGAIRGYVPGLAGCYEVPADAAPPALGAGPGHGDRRRAG